MTQPEEMPVWARKILRSVEDLEADPVNTTEWGSRLVTRCTPEFMNWLKLAARIRGMNVGAYIRRSVSKQLAKDLDLDIYEILKTTPYPGPYGRGGMPASRYRKGRNGMVSVPDDGSGYGDWQW